VASSPFLQEQGGGLSIYPENQETVGHERTVSEDREAGTRLANDMFHVELTQV